MFPSHKTIFSRVKLLFLTFWIMALHPLRSNFGFLDMILFIQPHLSIIFIFYLCDYLPLIGEFYPFRTIYQQFIHILTTKFVLPVLLSLSPSHFEPTPVKLHLPSSSILQISSYVVDAGCIQMIDILYQRHFQREIYQGLSLTI